MDSRPPLQGSAWNLGTGISKRLWVKLIEWRPHFKWYPSRQLPTQISAAGSPPMASGKVAWGTCHNQFAGGQISPVTSEKIPGYLEGWGSGGALNLAPGSAFPHQVTRQWLHLKWGTAAAVTGPVTLKGNNVCTTVLPNKKHHTSVVNENMSVRAGKFQMSFLSPATAELLWKHILPANEEKTG